MTPFDKALSFVLGNEGGYSNDPDDRGGARSGARGRDTKYYWTALGRCIQSSGGTSTDYHLLLPVSPTNALYATNGGEASEAEALGTISKVMGGQYIFLDASRVVPTAVENRPVNVALLPCIIYE